MVDKQGRLSLAYQNLSEIPANVQKHHASQIYQLDLSHNKFSDLRSLEDFTNLHTLILDNNELTSHVSFPHLPSISTLWLNRNKISNLSVIVEKLRTRFPKLKYLSLMNNPGAPSFFNGGTYQQYMDYRHYVISQLPSLETLDDQFINMEERLEAVRIYKQMVSKKKTIKTAKKKRRKKSSPTGDEEPEVLQVGDTVDIE
ncbi:leucine-rich melanocyte differentiation-associated protein-like [Anneissia japonica]|uniref:leucine-rich melanocyte differentiation-associated protein-like n=1 Tax=Anneissia japonica TaxID=1529436 RepID=UPI0014256C34|nr:leucine-rich melanocyte differentiation-associated protein-like [Anneissia japonica]